MVELVADNTATVEIGRYSPDATLAELVEAIAEALARSNACRDCCTCCSDEIPVNGIELRSIRERKNRAAFGPVLSSLVLPERPDMRARRTAIADLAETFEVSPAAATLLYECNNASPLRLRKKEDGGCLLLAEGLCKEYSARPLVCRLYYCRLGRRLAAVTDMVVSQGVWHSYCVMGWIAEAEVAHNPFLDAAGYEDILLSRFDVPLPEPGERAASLL